MLRINYNKFNSKTSVRFLLILILTLNAFTAISQKLNNPNKSGPLGTNVNTLTGNLYIPRTDIYVPARGTDINISFHYNSFLFTQDYGYGKGWLFNYHIQYRQDTVPGNKLILWGDGREDQYDSLPGGTYRSPKGFFNKFSQYEPGKFRLTELNGIKFYFDNPAHKRITRLEEPNGLEINFVYTDTLLTSITNSSGQSVTFTYNEKGRISTVVDALATPTRTFTYTYDATGNLKEVKDPLDGKYQYTYLINGPMKSLADKNDNKIDIIYYPDMSIRELIGCNKRISFSYDTTSQTTIVTDHLESGNQVTTYKYQAIEKYSYLKSISGNCCGFNVKYEYDDAGNQIKMIDAKGAEYLYTYDSSGNMLTAKDPSGNINTYTYISAFNKIKTFIDPKGNVYTLNYDVNGNLTEILMPGNSTYSATYNPAGDIATSTDPKGNKYTYNYDAIGNPAYVSGPGGYTATLLYDERGRLLSYTDARGNSTSAEYDILNRLKKITDPINNNAQFTYDAAGNLITYINSNNETSTFNYDAANRLVKTTGPTGNTRVYTYDGMNNITSIQDAMGQVIKLKYDNRNRLKEMMDPEDNRWLFSYDNNGKVTTKALPNGRSLNYTYDESNRLTAINDDVSEIASLTYDKNGNVLSYTNANGGVYSGVYDDLNHIIKVTDPLGNNAFYNYDKNNNVIAVTDREGHTTNFTYDSLNRVKTYTDNNGFVITVGYDAMNNVTSLTDQKNNITTYTYDNLNRRKRMIYPDGRYLENTYDVKGNIAAIRLTDGTGISYVYDTLNRVKNRILPGGETFTFTYDKLGRVLTATNNQGTITYTYDALSRVTSETFDGRTINYSYSIAGRTQTTIYPDSAVVVKEFDARNRLVKILKDEQILAEYSYNNSNQIITKKSGNGITSILQYDFANRLSSIVTRDIQNISFEYDKEMNKTAINHLNDPSLSEQFTYDNGYRLTNYKRGPSGSPLIQNTYAYDAVGNRTAANLNGVAMNYATNNLNQLTAVNATGFTYDNRGNLIFDGIYHKKYDAENRLVKDSVSPANVITYTYDAFNRRITKTINGNTLKYTYSGVLQIEERNNTNDILNRTVFSGYLSPVLNENNGNGYYYHLNQVNSVDAVTNADGRLIEKYRYDVFGKPVRFDSLNNILASSTVGNRYGFTGQIYDETGNYQFFYRNYSPETGVFNQRDPIEYEDGMGMYQYVGNNPANGIDVWGLACGDETIEGSNIIEDKFPLGISVSGATSYYFDETISDASNAKTKTAKELQREINNYGDYRQKNSKISSGKSLNATKRGANAARSEAKALSKAAKPAKALGFGFGLLDLAVKGIVAGEEFNDGWSNEQKTEEVQAGGDVALSLLGFTPIGGGFGLIDAGVELVSGDGVTTHTASFGTFLGDAKSAYESDRPIKMQWGRPAREDENLTTGNIYAYLFYDVPYSNLQSNPCDNNKGTRNRNKFVWDEEQQMFVWESQDPNLIIGPEGVPDKAWVSVKDRLPYTVMFENDSNATARARYVKITTPVEPKQDANTLELGSVGFNNETFDIPAGVSSYYKRLDARDSTGVFVDLTAGYDVFNNQVFWEFQAIDPITLMPPEDPLAGFLFLHDDAKPTSGNGFVNFSVKPRQNAQTLDTIGARASIIFDENEVIPTNIHTNTIDAVAPVSHMNPVAGTNFNAVTLSWTGADDTNGCGIDFYTVYVSRDQVNYTVLIPQIRRNDTTLTLPADTLYCFFVLATDRTGNAETLRQGEIICASFIGPVPVTWLYFNGTNQGKQNHLSWATASEQNSREFRLERSLTGNNFSEIAVIPSAGNSNTIKTYSYIDKNIDVLGSNIMLYRLKQVDISNNYKYSNIVKLFYSADGKTPSIAYPNPTNRMVSVLLGDISLIGSEALLTDINGRILQRITFTSANQLINLSKYVNGVYFIRLKNKETLKIIKQ